MSYRHLRVDAAAPVVPAVPGRYQCPAVLEVATVHRAANTGVYCLPSKVVPPDALLLLVTEDKGKHFSILWNFDNVRIAYLNGSQNEM